MKRFVEIKNLKKQVDLFHLGPINLYIEPGTITVLVGDNGSGKSTLMKIMMNLVNADEGHVKMFDNLVEGDSEDWKNQVAYHAQKTLGYDSFSGKDLIELISHWYPSWNQEMFDELVIKLDLPLDKKFGKLSQGVQQKLTFALTIARNPKLLILDEPTAFIDIPSQQLFIEIITEWMEDGERAILLASHQSEDIKKLADYLMILRSGKLIGHFEKEALIESYRSYWLIEPIPSIDIPGSVSQRDQALISNKPSETESFFKENNIEYTNSSAVSLEEIITILLTKNL